MSVEDEAAAIVEQSEVSQALQDVRNVADGGAMLAVRLWYQMLAAEAMPEDFRRALVGQAMQEFWESEFHCHGHEGSE